LNKRQSPAVHFGGDGAVSKEIQQMTKYVALSLVVMFWANVAAEDNKPVANSRSFEFTYATTVKGLPSGKTARIWIPVPSTSSVQTVTMVKDATRLPEYKIGQEKLYGNRILYVEAKADDKGQIPLQITYKVKRLEVKTNGGASYKPSASEKIARLLEPDEKVPIAGKPLTLLKDRKVGTDPMDAAKLFYDVVNRHMRYSKEGQGWGQGDAVWACDSKFGNCTDFHSLFISLARAHKIPAKFEIGFPLPPQRGAGKVPGYHCWAWFLPEGKGWIPVDISEANRNPKMVDYYFGNLTENRIQFSTGRDIRLVPPQKGPPLNFFIYPYVEVDGKPYRSTNVANSFSFRDLD
jgi:transglutaminase-like putative cysteine protease